MEIGLDGPSDHYKRKTSTYLYNALTIIPIMRPKVAPTAIDGTKIPAGTFKKESLNMSIGTFTPNMSIY